MTDQSFLCWHISLRCDDPRHRELTGRDPEEDQWIETEIDLSKAAWRHAYRDNGFIFHRDNRVTCPTCASALATPPSPALNEELSDDR